MNHNNVDKTQVESGNTLEGATVMVSPMNLLLTNTQSHIGFCTAKQKVNLNILCNVCTSAVCLNFLLIYFPT